MAEPTPLRKLPVVQSPSERIADLQKALNAERDLLEQRTMDTLMAAAEAAGYASVETSRVGLQQEFSRLSKTIMDALQRMEAIRGRS